MNTTETLIAARALISDPERWTKMYMEKDGCFCAAGAVCHVAGDADSWITAWGMLDRAAPNNMVVRFNDAPETTHDDIMALFDLAILISENVNA